MTEQLYLHIQKLVPAFTVAQEKIAPFFQTKPVKKEELLLNEKEICDTIYFVNKGCLYLFYEDNEEKQVIHFALENWWITDYKTFPDGKPAVYSIAAMEDSEITCISRKIMRNCFQHILYWLCISTKFMSGPMARPC